MHSLTLRHETLYSSLFLPDGLAGEDHLPGAINLPLRKIEAAACRPLDRARPIIVYCADSA